MSTSFKIQIEAAKYDRTRSMPLRATEEENDEEIISQKVLSHDPSLSK